MERTPAANATTVVDLLAGHLLCLLPGETYPASPPASTLLAGVSGAVMMGACAWSTVSSPPAHGWDGRGWHAGHEPIGRRGPIGRHGLPGRGGPGEAGGFACARATGPAARATRRR